jgi:hypothetical protein
MHSFVQERLEQFRKRHPTYPKKYCKRQLQKLYDGMAPYMKVVYLEQQEVEIKEKLHKLADTLNMQIEPSSEPTDDLDLKEEEEVGEEKGEEEVGEDEKKWRQEAEQRGHKRTETVRIVMESAPPSQQEEQTEEPETESAPACVLERPKTPYIKPLEEWDPPRPFAEKYPLKWNLRKTHGAMKPWLRRSPRERKGIQPE